MTKANVVSVIAHAAIFGVVCCVAARTNRPNTNNELVRGNRRRVSSGAIDHNRLKAARIKMPASAATKKRGGNRGRFFLRIEWARILIPARMSKMTVARGTRVAAMALVSTQKAQSQPIGF